MRREELTHQFVDSAPAQLDEGVLYVSIAYATALHKCCCGCGNEVVTALSPARYRMTFDGDTVSLHPSIGNWGLPCRSHYWIERNRVRWAGRWSSEEIEAGRAADRLARDRYFTAKSPAVDSNSSARPPVPVDWRQGLWGRFKRYCLQLFR